MAPQLGMGTFRIDQLTPPAAGAAHVLADGNNDEVWALKIGVFTKPAWNGGAPVSSTICIIPVGALGFSASGDGMCQYLASIGEDPNDYEIRVHRITPHKCS